MTRISVVAAAVFTIAAARLAEAQVVDVPTLSRAGVAQVLQAAEAEARRNSWNVSIAVVDPAGMLLGFVRLDDAPMASVDLSVGKARTAARFKRPSKAMEELAAARPAFVGLEGVALIEGGVPIVVRNRVVGAVGVSGVTSVQDAQVAQAGAGGVAPAGGR